MINGCISNFCPSFDFSKRLKIIISGVKSNSFSLSFFNYKYASNDDEFDIIITFRWDSTSITVIYESYDDYVTFDHFDSISKDWTENTWMLIGTRDNVAYYEIGYIYSLDYPNVTFSYTN